MEVVTSNALTCQLVINVLVRKASDLLEIPRVKVKYFLSNKAVCIRQILVLFFPTQILMNVKSSLVFALNAALI